MSCLRITFVLFCVALAAPAAEIPGLTLTPVAIPTPRTVNPYRIGPGSNGRIWFTDVNFRQVGFIASSGAITAFKLVDSVDPNNEVRPLAITEGPDGNGWFTVSVTDSSGSPLRTEIGRVTPTGVITRFPTPTVDACRVFGRAPVCGITVGPDGNLWFTETQAQRIGKITLSGQITEYLADGPGGEFFYGITAGPDGNLWVGDVFNSIVRITPAGVITFFDRPQTNVVGITGGPDGNVWFTEAISSSIGRITPAGVITLFPTPSPMSFPFGIVAGSDGKLYFTESAAAPKIGQIDPATGVINESAVTGRGQLFGIISLSGGSNARIGIAVPGDVEVAIQSATTNPPEELITRGVITGGPPPSSSQLKLEKTFSDERIYPDGEATLMVLSLTNTGETEVSLDGIVIHDRFPECIEDDFGKKEITVTPPPGRTLKKGERFSASIIVRSLKEVEARCVNEATFSLRGVVQGSAKAALTIDDRQEGQLRLIDLPIVTNEGRPRDEE